MSRGKESNVWEGIIDKSGRLEKMHPHLLFTYLGLAGVVFMFLVLVVVFVGAHVYTVKENTVRLPVSFVASTAVLFLSSAAIWAAGKVQKKENYRQMVACLSAALCFACMFLALQFIGWNELQLQGVFLTGAASGSYVYLLSGLHLLHVVAGIGFVIFVLPPALRASDDPVQKLIYSTDKYRVLQMKLLSTYWHAISAVWGIIFLVFLLLIR